MYNRIVPNKGHIVYCIVQYGQKERKDMANIIYGKLSPMAIKSIGETASRNKMKRLHGDTGRPEYDIKELKYSAQYLEEFMAIGVSAIYEYMVENDCLTHITREQLYEARRYAYRKCDQFSDYNRKTMYKHLYIETPYIDDEGNECGWDIVDVTADIEHENDREFWETIEPYTSLRDRKILKLYSKGYADETIAKRLGIYKNVICTNSDGSLVLDGMYSITKKIPNISATARARQIAIKKALKGLSTNPKYLYLIKAYMK